MGCRFSASCNQIPFPRCTTSISQPASRSRACFASCNTLERVRLGFAPLGRRSLPDQRVQPHGAQARSPRSRRRGGRARSGPPLPKGLVAVRPDGACRRSHGTAGDEPGAHSILLHQYRAQDPRRSIRELAADRNGPSLSRVLPGAGARRHSASCYCKSDKPEDQLARDPKRLDRILAETRARGYGTRDPGLHRRKLRRSADRRWAGGHRRAAAGSRARSRLHQLFFGSRRRSRSSDIRRSASADLQVAAARS